MANQYVRYSPSLERKEPDEDAMIARIVESMSRANVEVYKKHRHGLRDAHAKSHAVLAGEVRIHEGLPEHAAPWTGEKLFRCHPRIISAATCSLDEEGLAFGMRNGCDSPYRRKMVLVGDRIGTVLRCLPPEAIASRMTQEVAIA